jgi:propionate CoA-transferase
MDWVERARALAKLGRWGLSMLRHDARYPSPVPDNPRFLSPLDAAKRIPDRAVVAVAGLGGTQRASILFWAIREAFESGGHPRKLTLINLGGHGGRGMAPGTMEELGRPGLCTRFVTSHFETFHAMLNLADAGRCELQCLPLGIMALLYDAQRRGTDTVVADTGIGTFLDPRRGRGSPVGHRRAPQLVEAVGGRLRYRMPRIDVALFNVPAADRHGNLYATHAANIGDSYEIARAAKRNGGLVIANVGLLVDKGYDRIFLPARDVDAVVYYPNTEQMVGFFHREPWLAVTPNAESPVAEGLAHARFVNRVARIAPRRSSVDEAVARLAADTLATAVRKGARVSIGTGLSEQVPRIVFEHGRLGDMTFLVESGTVGGVPAPGVLFGTAFSPDAIVSPAEIFKLCYRRLDATCLGALQVDAKGSVNVSKRGDGVRDYIGPGGFIDFAETARVIVFVCSWMVRGEMALEDGTVRIVRRGTPKFVERVDEVTFNGPRALEAGKRVFYATPVGLFRLTARGIELVRVMPGIDVHRDIVDFAQMPVALPAGIRAPLVSRSIVTGQRFRVRVGPRK